ncbi:MAG: VWA domain-containing protein [Chloroflexia bacterium]|nr:VWA domain-containing protein [Chloroflexia bacterium]
MTKKSWLTERWCLAAALASLLLLGPVGALYGQEQVNVTINEVDASQFPNTIAYVTVSDGQGRAIADLPRGAFTLAEDGAPVDDLALDTLENMGEPIMLALALDTSGSMGGYPLANTKTAAAQLINDLGPADMAALLSFASEVTVRQDLTADKTAVIADIEALTAAGDTALYDGIYQASTLLASRPRGRKAVVVLTDGQDTNSTLELEDAVAQAREASIPVYVIGFGSSIQPDNLERVAMLTGGRFFQSPSSEEVENSFAEVARLLRHQYVLSFQSSLRADDTLHTLQVAVEVQGVSASSEGDFVAASREIEIEMVAPAAGETVGGIVTLKPRIDAPGEVLQVDYLLDGNPLARVSTGDFAYEWDTAAVALGSHSLTVRATDSAGNTGETEMALSLAEPITVAFVTPTGSSPVRGEVPIELQVTSLAGIAQLELALDGAVIGTTTGPPWGFNWDTTALETGPYTLTATAYDVAGQSTETRLDIFVGIEIQMPSIQEGATVGGIIYLKPLVEAPEAVQQVEYYLDGASLTTVTGGDFAYLWDATAVPHGDHTLTVRATDASGSFDELGLDLVFAPAVTVSFSSPGPEGLEKLSGKVIVEADASALTGLDRVEFSLDGQVVETFQSPPYRYTWDTASVATGPHTVAATAYDMNGLSEQAVLETWVAIRGAGWGLGLLIAILVVGIGIMLPITARRRRRLTRPMNAAAVAPPRHTVMEPARPRPPAEKGEAEMVNGEPVAWLVIEEGRETGRRWALSPGETTLGRSRSDSDIVIQASTASRRHAVIRVEEDLCTYFDLEPTNPTLINDEPLIGAHELDEGDRIQIGEVSMRFTKERVP